MAASFLLFSRMDTKQNALNMWANQNNVSVADLAKRLGCTYECARKYLNKGDRPSVDMLIKLRDITGLSIDELICESASTADGAPDTGNRQAV